MMERLKRYSMALVVLLFVILLMMLGTYGVEKFGSNMLEKAGQKKLQPRGENVRL